MKSSYYKPPLIPPEICSTKAAVLSLLAYFDIFNHPLKIEDLVRMKGFSLTTCEEVMRELVDLGVCFEWDGYYGLDNSIQIQAERRIFAEKNALNYWSKVRKNAQRIANFPFVRGVAISGSLSKGVMAVDGDIDFFIITAPNKLWVTRTLLILYKKIRLLNSRKYFCLNYFVDTENLEIVDKNMFTAVEVAHLIPVYAENALFEQFYAQNKWVQDFLDAPAAITKTALPADPYYGLNETIQVSNSKKRKEEWLNGKIGASLENWTHKKTLKRWMRKFGHFNEEKFELTMRSTKGVSKHHPRDFQSKVLDTYQERFENALNIFLNSSSSK
jgi:hypothetical protein